ncbi:type I secretion system permease/ATPase [Aquabacterium sp. J223]|uniref:type I secretion system permease/ATPase n=1 Tax=Aquabacterium sp. J223 TaxID=2898431 RepID=UPI0021AD9197|nr:type I secretion system permease/ATPase [Aquabacterium sp. J223]UUX97899.1 type I secretion system permease/ATPase [Aquabacterium sp. J223]
MPPPLPRAAPEDRAPADDQPLLHALSWLTRHHGAERSPASLLAGLPMEQGRFGPTQAVRALKEAGFNAGLVKRSLAELPTLLMPAVLLLRGSEACIVAGRRGGGQAGAVYDVVMPGPEHHACTATEAELVQEYTGFALVASPKVEARAGVAEEGLRDPSSHWLWGTLRRFIPYYRSAMVAALLSNLLMLVTGILTSVIYDKVIPHKAFVTLWALAIGGFLAMGFDLLARQLRAHLIDLAGKKTDLLIGSLLFRQTLSLRMEHRPGSAGGHAHHHGQVEVVREFFASASLSAISDVPFALLFVAMTFVIGGPLGWVLVIALPLIAACALFIQGALRRAMHANMAQQADLHGLMVEAVEGLEDVKTAGAQGRFLHRFEQANAAAADSSLRSRRLTAWANNVAMIGQQAVTLVMLVWGVYLIADGVITGGALIGAVMMAGRAILPLGGLVSLAMRYQGARAAMSALDKLMALPVEREPGRAYIAHRRLTGRIGLHDVGFAYPSPAGSTTPPPKVLKGVTLRFAPGERVVILGRIGSGKSTILRLMAGLYQPTEGLVEVDGIDLRQLDSADFRSKVGFVSQEPRLFNGTLRENVLMGRHDADASRLAEVAQLTGLDRLVASHPQGWELPVGEMGGLLSGGQRQLVALARCLVTRPQILLMDEPTSSMDAQSETMFLRQLKEAAGPCTLVMVTHRPAVLELAQRVVVVDAGRLVMDGPKDQVLAALSGAKPAAAAASTAPPNVLRHPTAQPMAAQPAV